MGRKKDWPCMVCEKLYYELEDAERCERSHKPPATTASVVLDPFCGSGTVGVVCEWYGRDFLGLELGAEYADQARHRIATEGRGRPRQRAQEAAPGQLALLGGEPPS